MRARQAAHLLALGPHGWGRVARTAWIAWRIERSLASESLERTARRFGAGLSFEPPPSPAQLTGLDQRERAELALAARVLAHRPFNGTCLRRALVFADVLRARSPLLRVGVAKVNGSVSAHAWLEIDGISLDPMALARFSVLRPAAPEVAR